jgi:zinc transporter ZupT
MLVLAVTLHNIPEGMAVGVAIAGAVTSDFSTAGALALSLGIAIQNIPEGAIISMPMYAAGNSRWRSFLIGTMSGVVEPIGSLAIILLASALGVALPYLLAFAAGAMMYVVVEDLISTGGSSLKAVAALRDYGCEVIGMVASFTYGFPVAEQAFQEAGCQLVTLSDYAAVLEQAVETGYIRKENLDVLNEWRKNPSEWMK